MKYNKSKIMKNAWKQFKRNRDSRFPTSFSRCLQNAWRNEKMELSIAAEKAAEEAVGIITMHYSEYKNNYSFCKTVKDSYDKYDKTIKVYTNGYVSTTATTNKTVEVASEHTNGRCPICGTWCYGDCTA